VALNYGRHSRRPPSVFGRSLETVEKTLVYATGRSAADNKGSAEIPRLRADRLQRKVGNVDVPRLDPTRRLIARIMARRAMVELVTTPVRQRKAPVSITDTGQRVGQVVKPIRDNMDHLSLALDPPVAARQCPPRTWLPRRRLPRPSRPQRPRATRRARSRLSEARHRSRSRQTGAPRAQPVPPTRFGRLARVSRSQRDEAEPPS